LRLTLEKFGGEHKLPPPIQTVDLNPNALTEEIERLGMLLQAVSRDKDLSNPLKADFTEIIAAFNLTLKRALAGSVEPETRLTSSSVKKGQTLSALRGIRVSAVKMHLRGILNDKQLLCGG
jgi:hypothetical protein